MIIVKIMGGLGNQLFQYALVEKLKSMGKNVKVDLSFYITETEGVTNRDSIYEGLNLPYKIAPEKKCLYYQGDSITNKLYRKLARKSLFIVETEPSFKPEILLTRRGLLFGYWQSEKYFDDIREILVGRFNLDRLLDDTRGNAGDKTRNMLRMLESDIKDEHAPKSVALHIRGGDYLNEFNKGTFGGICTKEYYSKATEYITKMVNYPKFYIFTNDRKYAEEIMSGLAADYQYVDWNDESHSYADLLLMSKCKHHILANSSFSWWGEYLSDQSGITVAPSRWTNDSDNKDIYRDNWVVL